MYIDSFILCILGFEYSEDETTALIQHEGGPCAVLAPVQAYLLKNLLFGPHKLETVKWKELTGNIHVHSWVNLNF